MEFSKYNKKIQNTIVSIQKINILISLELAHEKLNECLKPNRPWTFVCRVRFLFIWASFNIFNLAIFFFHPTFFPIHPTIRGKNQKYFYI